MWIKDGRARDVDSARHANPPIIFLFAARKFLSILHRPLLSAYIMLLRRTCHTERILAPAVLTQHRASYMLHACEPAAAPSCGPVHGCGICGARPGALTLAARVPKFCGNIPEAYDKTRDVSRRPSAVADASVQAPVECTRLPIQFPGAPPSCPRHAPPSAPRPVAPAPAPAPAFASAPRPRTRRDRTARPRPPPRAARVFAMASKRIKKVSPSAHVPARPSARPSFARQAKPRPGRVAAFASRARLQRAPGRAFLEACRRLRKPASGFPRNGISAWRSLF